MLAPYLRKADTTSMLLPYFKDADTTSLNLTSRFAAKQNILNGTGFVKASGLNITYDNSSYLRTGLADSTYLPLTGGTLTGNLRLASSNATQLNIDANDNNLESRITFSTIGSARTKIYTTSSVSSMTFESIAQASARRGFRFISSTEGTQYLGLVQDPQGNVGIKSDAIGNDVHPNTLYVNGTLGVTGDITEDGNNVLTSADTATILNPYWRSGKFSGTLPIANGGTNANSASNARSNLNVDYIFLAITNGTFVGVSTNRVFIVNSGGSLTTQIDLTTDLTAGRTFMIKNLASGTIVSTASNVIPLNGGSASTPILGAGNATPQWCTLVCDGTNWHIIQRN
jgi:hypothetical protein